ncbi:helix-turn-helix domain-containing protein [Acinetobacter larvae]|uniref:HTH araC/xylS-type domain-containing protein n=1 Tax=Acinetobacter larvae TaxID=1789224 RepID=A0A1B2M185_9GAMM|nr:AraC family transcriptional regulator [Acinetobacter larvae]AOA58783.1 hypothetical protein BFG52_10760 [Acinetobacter larvae]
MKVFDSHSIRAKLQHLKMQRDSVPDHFGQGYTDSIQIESGLSLAYTDYMATQHIVEHSDLDLAVPQLSITFALQGYSYYLAHAGEEFQFRAGSTMVTALHQVRAERHYFAKQAVRQLRLLLSPAFLAQYHFQDLQQQLEQTRSAQQWALQRTTPQMLHLAEHIIALSHADASHLDFKIAALSLVASQFKQLQRPDQPAFKISSADEEKLYAALEMMQRDYAQPLGLDYLCLSVAMNRFKFKQAFKALFNITPHQKLIQIRMQQARQRLAAGEHVSVVAYGVGYKHVSNFSAAFLQYYGYRPKALFHDDHRE